MYSYICVFVLLYLCNHHLGTCFWRPWYQGLVNNIAYVGSYRHFIILSILVTVYLCICFLAALAALYLTLVSHWLSATLEFWHKEWLLGLETLQTFDQSDVLICMLLNLQFGTWFLTSLNHSFFKNIACGGKNNCVQKLTICLNCRPTSNSKSLVPFISSCIIGVLWC